MNELINKEQIESKIYEINGIQVMLDSDLADIYHVETKRVNEAVKNNPDKFPLRFSWILSDGELNDLWSKFSTANISTMSRVNPRVFTEQGVYMLATVLRSKKATQVSIAIMDAFVKMRHYINFSKEILPYKFLLIEKKVDDNTKRINELFDKFNPKEIIKECIFFKNDIFDAYEVLLRIFDKGQEEIIIIDNYANKELLSVIKNIKCNFIIVSSNINKTLKKKYMSQYNNVTFIKNDSMHDRFIIIDRRFLYSCGASFKDLGKKCFAINEIESVYFLRKLLEEIDLTKKE